MEPPFPHHRTYQPPLPGFSGLCILPAIPKCVSALSILVDSFWPCSLFQDLAWLTRLTGLLELFSLTQHLVIVPPSLVFLVAIILVQAAITKYHRLGGLQTTNASLSQSWRLEVWDQGLVLVTALFWVAACQLLIVSLHDGKRES